MPELIAAGFLVPILECMAKQYPRLSIYVEQVHTPTIAFPELEERKIDLVIARMAQLPFSGHLSKTLNAEIVLNDPFSLVVGPKNKWARRSKINLAELVNEPFVMTPMEALGGLFITEAFQKRGLNAPANTITTFSIHLRNNLVSNGTSLPLFPTLFCVLAPGDTPSERFQSNCRPEPRLLQL